MAGICAALSLVVLALYSQTMNFGFVNLDDSRFTDEVMINRGLTLEGVRWAFVQTEPYWQPFTTISHMLTYSLAGDAAGAHHMVNVVLHALNAVLLFLGLRSLSRETWPSALVAALFAVHPLRVESVAWVTERKDVLSGVFSMLLLIAYARYARRPALCAYTAVLVSFAIALMCKPMAMTLPVVLLLLDLWPLARWSGAPAAEGSGPRLSLLRLGFEKLPLFLLAALFLGGNLWATAGAPGLKSLDEISFGWRVALAPLSYGTYLAQSVWPSSLSAIYTNPALVGAPVESFLWQVSSAVVVLVATTILCLATWRTRPYLLVGWLWFIVMLAPVVNLVRPGSHWRADHYTYLPAIGLALMLAWTLRDLVVRHPGLRVAVSSAAVVALAALTIASWYDIRVWRDSTTLLENAVAATPDNYMAHQILGGTLIDKGDLAGARRHLEIALGLRPTEAFAQGRLGYLLAAEGDDESAEIHFREALRLAPSSDWLSRRGLVELYLRHGRFAEAIPHLETAVALEPLSPSMHSALGLALMQVGKFKEAAEQFKRVLDLDPLDLNALEMLRASEARAS